MGWWCALWSHTRVDLIDNQRLFNYPVSVHLKAALFAVKSTFHCTPASVCQATYTPVAKTLLLTTTHTVCVDCFEHLGAETNQQLDLQDRPQALALFLQLMCLLSQQKRAKTWGAGDFFFFLRDSSSVFGLRFKREITFFFISPTSSTSNYQENIQTETLPLALGEIITNRHSFKIALANF